MWKIDHIFYVLAALVFVLVTYVVLALTNVTNPKLMDGALLLIGALCGLARGDSPPGSGE